MSKIGLFGGSFDPIHKAHIDIANCALKELNLDEVQLIPTKNNPWKENDCVNVNHRLKMINIALENQKNIYVNTIEIDKDSNQKNYTIDTIRELKEKFPQHTYYYIMGMDQANKFHLWKNAKELSELVQLVAFQRGGYQVCSDNLKKYHFKLLHNEPIYSSSSEVRKGHIEMLDKNVLRYITKEGLYLETIVSSRMGEKRWKHTCSVAKLAKDIALSNNLDGKQAYIAGMFHDIAKEMDLDESKNIMERYFPMYVNKPIAIWHQWISRYISEKEYLIDDPVVLQAIENHTTASIDISQIGKCVYVADKLDPLRGYDSSKQIEICKKDIDRGFIDALDDFYQFSKSKQRKIDESFNDIYKYFVLKGEK